MPRIGSVLSVAVLRALVLAATLGAAAPAGADPRLVRVIWDVGQGVVHYKVFEQTQPGHDGFAVPADAAQAALAGFVTQTAGAVLRKDDRVRLYVVNYNPVAHVWDDSSVVEQIAKEPSLVGPLLNAALLAITGAAKFSTVTGSSFAMTRAVPADPGCGNLGTARTRLQDLQNAAKALHTDAADVVAGANTAGLRADAKKLAGIPTHATLWQLFDNARAWDAVLTVFGGDFTTKYATLATKIQGIDPKVDAANAALLAFDHEIALQTITDACFETAKLLVERRGHVVAFLEEVAGDESPLRQTLATFEAAGTLWSGYRRKLSRRSNANTWTDEAIEIILKEPIKTDAVLRIDAIFGSPDKTVTEQTQRSLVLEVQTHFPVLVIGSGVGYNNFNFKKLKIVKETTTAADGTVSAKSKFEIVDDTTWEAIIPVWIQSIRVFASSKAGLYGMFGTTPDRNIFKNAILGGSVVVPRWRTAFSFGAITARGYQAKDLQPIVDKFSSGGFALADVTADNVALPTLDWKWSPYVSVTFTLAGF
jgi:hypothetical protein